MFEEKLEKENFGKVRSRQLLGVEVDTALSFD